MLLKLKACFVLSGGGRAKEPKKLIPNYWAVLFCCRLGNIIVRSVHFELENEKQD